MMSLKQVAGDPGYIAELATAVACKHGPFCEIPNVRHRFTLLVDNINPQPLRFIMLSTVSQNWIKIFRYIRRMKLKSFFINMTARFSECDRQNI